MTDVSDDDLADLSKRVRAAQRRNMMVKLASVTIVLLGIGIGFYIRHLGAESEGPNQWKGAQWLGFIGGIVLGGAILKKFEVPVEDIE